MQQINVTLWCHEVENDWSVEFAGKFHRHVSANTVSELVEYAVVAAQEAEMDLAAPLGRSTALAIH
jgi:hypothetical protein